MIQRFSVGVLLIAAACTQAALAQVKPGADVLLEERLDLLAGKHVALVMNHTSRLRSGARLLDALWERNVRIVALFSPEHGIMGKAEAGTAVPDGTDEATGIPLYSLYGRARKPSPVSLKDVNVLVYDIQDVGARFYTYISTMGLCMEAAAESGIPFVVLDRPNPLGGLLVDGPLLDDSLRSFVGMYPIPVVYGLTAGELARMIIDRGWLNLVKPLDLRVVPMEGWKRSMRWPETGLPWIPPSPNLPTVSAVFAYPVTAYLEATNLSEGRGTPGPFTTIGAPFLDASRLSESLTIIRIPGLKFMGARFVPSSSKHRGRECEGVSIKVTAGEFHDPVAAGVRILHEVLRGFPGKVRVDTLRLARLLGSKEVSRMLAGGTMPDSVAAVWRSGVDSFRAQAKRYWLYPEK